MKMTQEYLHQYLFSEELAESHSAMGDCIGNSSVTSYGSYSQVCKKHMKQWKVGESTKVIDVEEEEKVEDE